MRRDRTLGMAILALSASVPMVMALSPFGGVATAGGSGTPPAQTRMYYLTKGYFAGAQVLQACARGYHFASSWELHEPSNLAYNARLGFQNAPYQMGPPTGTIYTSETQGWIDNGREAEPNGNCMGWTVDNPGGAGGRALSLTDDSMYSLQVDCSEMRRVWCVSNP